MESKLELYLRLCKTIPDHCRDESIERFARAYAAMIHFPFESNEDYLEVFYEILLRRLYEEYNKIKSDTHIINQGEMNQRLKTLVDFMRDLPTTIEQSLRNRGNVNEVFDFMDSRECLTTPLASVRLYKCNKFSKNASKKLLDDYLLTDGSSLYLYNGNLRQVISAYYNYIAVNICFCDHTRTWKMCLKIALPCSSICYLSKSSIIKPGDKCLIGDHIIYCQMENESIQILIRNGGRLFKLNERNNDKTIPFVKFAKEQFGWKLETTKKIFRFFNNERAKNPEPSQIDFRNKAKIRFSGELFIVEIR